MTIETKAITLIRTKLRRPRLPGDLIARPRLLVQALEDSDSAVWARTAWALGELAAPEARFALERAQARGPSLAVRQAAGQALTQIAEQPVVRTSRLASWALALSGWDRLLWLVLALSVLAAAWLWMVDRRRSLAPVA